MTTQELYNELERVKIENEKLKIERYHYKTNLIALLNGLECNNIYQLIDKNPEHLKAIGETITKYAKIGTLQKENNTMTREEKLIFLEEWKENYRKVEEKCDELAEILGDIFDSPLFERIWGMFQSYTEALSALIGDESEWLDWYCYECDMGNTPMEAGRNDNDMRLIETLNDLLDIIEDVK